MGKKPMVEEMRPRPGPIEGASRVLRELLRTPRFRQTVNILLGELDPENAQLLVRTLVWEDPEFFLSLLGATPDIVNTGINGLLELSIQLSSFPDALLSSFLAQIILELDGERLGQFLARAWQLLASMVESEGQDVSKSANVLAERIKRGFTEALPEPRGGMVAAGLIDKVMPAISAAATRIGAEAAREGSDANSTVKKLAENMRSFASENPDFMKAVVVPLAEAGREAFAATETAGEGA